jgi:hypothetical protein
MKKLFFLMVLVLLTGLVATTASAQEMDKVTTSDQQVGKWTLRTFSYEKPMKRFNKAYLLSADRQSYTIWLDNAGGVDTVNLSVGYVKDGTSVLDGFMVYFKDGQASVPVIDLRADLPGYLYTDMLRNISDLPPAIQGFLKEMKPKVEGAVAKPSLLKKIEKPN